MQSQYFTLIDLDTNIEVHVITAYNYHQSMQLVYDDILHEVANDSSIDNYAIKTSDNEGVCNIRYYYQGLAI